MSGDRIQTLREVYVIDPAWNKPADPAIEKRFQRIKAKLSGYMSEPERTLRKFTESNTGIPARYARAHAWHKSAYPHNTLPEVESLIATNPDAPIVLEATAQLLHEAGRPETEHPPPRQ